MAFLHWGCRPCLCVLVEVYPGFCGTFTTGRATCPYRPRHSPQHYRELIAGRLDDVWKPEFNTACGSEDVYFKLISEALAALFFYTNGGCSNCHDSVFFRPEKTRLSVYPAIGRGTMDDGSDIETYQVTSLLSLVLAGLYVHYFYTGS
jgi:hypothetical protein